MTYHYCTRYMAYSDRQMEFRLSDLYHVIIYFFSFFLFTTVTELPVDCPDFSDTVPANINSTTYFFVPPSYGPENVTLVPGVTEYYWSDETFSVSVSVAGGPYLQVGTHTITTVISDDVLNITCKSSLVVIGNVVPTLISFLWRGMEVGYIIH